MSKKEHFKIVKKIHKNRNNISLVKRRSDERLFIWKRSKSNSYKHIQSLGNQIKRAKLWRKFGISKVKIQWHKDKRSILKTYVKGKTLKQILDKDQNFFSKKSNELKSLTEFVENLIDSKHYIHDMKGANIVFDGKNWQVIDSGPIHKKSHSATKREYKKFLYIKWSKLIDSNKERMHLREFLDSF